MITEIVAKVLAINENGEVLTLTIGKHRKNPKRSYTADLPGGIVDVGELEVKAAVRELYEETGIEVDAHQCKLIYAETKLYQSENKSVTKLLYVLQLDFTPAIHLSWEHAEFRWVPREELIDVFKDKSFYGAAIGYCLHNKIVPVENLN